MSDDTRLRLPVIENPAAVGFLIMLILIVFLMGRENLTYVMILCVINGFLIGMLTFGRWVPVGKTKQQKGDINANT